MCRSSAALDQDRTVATLDITHGLREWAPAHEAAACTVSQAREALHAFLAERLATLSSLRDTVDPKLEGAMKY